MEIEAATLESPAMKSPAHPWVMCCLCTGILPERHVMVRRGRGKPYAFCRREHAEEWDSMGRP